MKVEELLWHLERTADPSFAADWDSCGIQVRGATQDIRKLAVTLDPTLDRIQEAIGGGADFILAHHPLSLQPKLPAAADDFTAVLRALFRSDTWLYSAHTSLDVCTHGPPSWLANSLGLKDISAIAPLERERQTCLRYRIAGRLDAELLDQLKTDPGVISIDQAPADMADILVRPEARQGLLRLLESQAVAVRWTEMTELLIPDDRERGYGLIGDLVPPLSWSDLAARLARQLDLSLVSRVGRVREPVSRLAYCPGSGMSLAARAFASGAQVFVSGDLKYHQAQELEPLGLVLDVGHFSLEEKMMRAWADDLAEQLADRDIQVEFLSGESPLYSENLSSLP